MFSVCRKMALECFYIPELCFSYWTGVPECLSLLALKVFRGLFLLSESVEGKKRMRDEEYMRLALELAEKGCGWTSPNPMVGAVIVKDGRIIGFGWHERWGTPHAERNALASCQESPKGGTMYVTLEPCCHHGRQPPCTDAILEG